MVFIRIRDDIEERIHQVMNHKSCTNIDIGILPFKAELVSTGIKKIIRKVRINRIQLKFLFLLTVDHIL